MYWQSDPLQSMQPRRRLLWQNLVEAAVETIGELGYAGTSIQDITDRVGVSRTQFYFLFEDKEQCFLATQLAILAELETRLRNADYSGLDWPEAVRVGVETVTGALDETPAFARLIFVETRVAGADAVQQYRDALNRLAPWLDRGREFADDPESLPDDLAEMAVDAAAGLIVRQLQEGTEESFGALDAKLHFALLLPYMGPAAAGARAYGR